MQLVEKQRSDVYINAVFVMRRSGATLQQIGEKIGRTRERVRQILLENYGSARHGLISTEQLRRQLGLSRPRVMELYHNNIIAPRRKWKTNGIYFLLWSPDIVKKAHHYLTSGVPCKMCKRPVPINRRTFCSDKCYLENRKYKYKNTAAKKKQLENIRRYRERKRALSTIVGVTG